MAKSYANNAAAVGRFVNARTHTTALTDRLLRVSAGWWVTIGTCTEELFQSWWSSAKSQGEICVISHIFQRAKVDTASCSTRFENHSKSLYKIQKFEFLARQKFYYVLSKLESIIFWPYFFGYLNSYSIMYCTNICRCKSREEAICHSCVQSYNWHLLKIRFSLLSSPHSLLPLLNCQVTTIIC